MQKAFDTILGSEVSADLVAQSGGCEPYRYECACCGEEVYVAAPYSTRMVAHFRHRNGNNDMECENYLGKYGMINIDARSRISNRERVEFYFDYMTKTFSLGLRFSENEIQGYEKQCINLELRLKELDKPFYALKINSAHFTPDAVTMIKLNIYSTFYYLSNTLNNTKRKHNFFIHKNMPVLFKILGNDKEFKAKLVRSPVLYTNTQYFAVIQNKYSVNTEIIGINNIEIIDFETMGHKFTGIILTILEKTPKIDSMISSWGYQLEASEILTLLWPPATHIDDVSVIDSDYVFLYSSFTLQAHGNINVHSEDIAWVSNGISKVSVKSKTKVYKKNAEITIDKRERKPLLLNEIRVEECVESRFKVPDDSLFFLFNRSGAKKLSKGQSVLLSPQSVINHYYFGYLIKRIKFRQKKGVVGRALLNDILAHYRRTEQFNKNIFCSLTLSETASQYINGCEDTGLINPIARQFIEEGRL